MKINTTILIIIFLTLQGRQGHAKNRPAQEKGEKVFKQQGCLACHGPQSIQGPRLGNLYGSLVKLNSGKVIKADESYLRHSLINPEKDIVNGFEPIMPSYQGAINEEDLDDLIEYLKHKSL